MQDERTRLDRIRFSGRLSLWQATVRGLGIITAGIIFVLLGQTAELAGSLAPLAILLTALLVAANHLAYAELALRSGRPGGAYTLVREGFSGGGPPFLTGWALALSELGLCGLLAQGAARHLSLLLTDLCNIAIPPGLLALGLMTVALLGSSVGRRGGRRWPVVILTAIALFVLVVIAAPRSASTAVTATYSLPGSAIALLMAAYAGAEGTAGYQGEMRRRTTSVPRALVLTPMLASALGVALAIVVPSAAENTWAPLAPLGEAIAGPIGRMVALVLGSALLTIVLGRVLRMVVRHLYIMSEDGFWPAWLSHISAQRRIPLRLICLVSLLALPTVWLPTRLLSETSGLLYLFVLMAVNLTLARQPRQAVPAGFSLPFHPWVPALTLAVDVLITPIWGWAAVGCTAGCLAAGALLYMAYGKSRYIAAREGITIFRAPEKERAPKTYRILVPIANPATASALLRLASQIARSHGGEVLALQVVVIPEPVPLEAGRRRGQISRVLLDETLKLIAEEELPVQTMTRVARSVAQGILETAAEEDADLIVIDWHGLASSRATSLGRVVGTVLRDAPCDVFVVREQDALPKKILIPTAGGPHAQAAIRLAASIADAEITLLCVQTEPGTSQQIKETQCQIAEDLQGLDLKHPPEQKAIRAVSAARGIIQEAEGYDLVLMGVSEEGLLDKLVFGSIPLQVAARVPQTALVQAYRGLTGLWSRRILRTLRKTFPPLSKEEQLEIRHQLSEGARPGVNYFVLIVLSCIIAALGLLLNSPAVVIGAMLVAPLMSPILALSLGFVLGEPRMIRFSAEAIFKGVAMAVIIAAFIGLLSPLKMTTEEMLARASPTLLDLVVALASGMAGAYAMSRKGVSAALPGVAIAAALMPPLATVGLGLSLGEPHVAGGAFLLFAANIAAISLAGGVVFLLLGLRPQRWEPESRRRLWQRLSISLLLLLVIAVPLGIIMAGIVRDATQERVIETVLVEHLAGENSHLVGLEIDREGAALLIVATVRSTSPLDQETVSDLAHTLSQQLGHPVQLEVVVLLAVQS